MNEKQQLNAQAISFYDSWQLQLEIVKKKYGKRSIVRNFETSAPKPFIEATTIDQKKKTIVKIWHCIYI